LAMKRDTVVVKPFLEHLEQIVTPLDAAFGAYLSELEHWVTLPPEEALGLIVQAGMAEDTAVEAGTGISPYVVSSVLWSLYAFLSSPSNYWRTVTTAIIVGGDVDTTAAMAGAISGALNGFDALPGRLLPSLNDQGNWGVEELVVLARKVCAMKLGTDQLAGH
jgi:poly(ADP-ribose) glycohydrolase ARH3